MAKRVKMCLYGEPGVGKSVFASKAPKPFFITTDGNYAWLEDFGADPTAYIQVSSWVEAKKVFQNTFDNYETIVVDLTEDLFKWCEQEFCVKNRIEHVSDIGYGKGYDITRNEFFIEICKLLNLDKNVILIMHGITFTVKDRRGVEHTKYGPSSRMPDKLLDMIEGRVRYFLRAYLKAEETEDKKLVKKRYLSLIPKENEFGICRGIDENKVPHDIPLDFNTFADLIGVDVNVKETKPVKKVEKKEEPIIEKKEEIEVNIGEPKIDSGVIQKYVEETKVEETIESKEEIQNIPEETPVTSKEENKVEVKEEKPQQKEEKVMSNEDKLAAIKAKLAAMKASKGE